MACCKECSDKLRRARTEAAIAGLQLRKITSYRPDKTSDWIEVWENGDNNFTANTCCASNAKAQYIEWRTEQL